MAATRNTRGKGVKKQTQRRTSKRMVKAGKWLPIYNTFLDALRGSVSVSQACDRIGIKRVTVYAMRKRNPKFATAMDDAYDEGTDRLEDHATVRAVVGSKRPVFQGGKEVGQVVEYSDRLLEVLLRGRRPEKYKDAKPAAPGAGDKLAGLGAIRIESLTDAQLDRLIERLAGNDTAGGADPGKSGA